MISLFFLSFLSFAEMKHEHGVAELFVGLSGKEIAVTMNIPADTILGFEHEAKSEADKKKLKAKLDKFKKEFFEYVNIGYEYKCRQSKLEAEIKREGNHSEIAVTGTATCVRDITNGKLIVRFKDYYPTLKKITVNLVSDKKNQSFSFLKGQGEADF